MSLVIEDGTIVVGAQSYVTAAEAKAYATLRGLTFPTLDADVEKLLVLASDMLLSLESKFKGDRYDDAQVLSWPRQGVYLYNNPTAVAVTYIPQQLKDAQCQLAVDASTTPLQPNGTGRQVISTQVGPIATAYSDTRSTNVQPVFNKAMGILAPLLKATSGLTTLRV